MSRDHLFEADCIAAEQELDRLYAINAELLAALEEAAGALAYCALDPGQLHPTNNAQRCVAGNALVPARAAIKRAKEAK